MIEIKMKQKNNVKLSEQIDYQKIKNSDNKRDNNLYKPINTKSRNIST